MTAHTDIFRDLQPKRLHSKPGLDSLYPYYAGFSYSFVESLLRAHNLSKDSLVLDPWNGSGTTTAAAQRLGFRAIGIDLNPFASLVAKAKLASLSDALAVYNRATTIAKQIVDGKVICYDYEPLLAWMPTAAASMTRSLVERINLDDESNPLDCLLAITLASACRHLTVTNPSSNPTWVTPRRVSRLQRRTLLRAWVERVSEASQLIADNPAVEPGRECNIRIGDSRQLPLSNETVDLVISSPPYCTRIDYAVKTRLELDVLGIFTPDGFCSFRHEMMGTTTLRNNRRFDLAIFPETVADLLMRIKEHPSHRASGYYFPGFVQYFSDAIKSLGEIRRVLNSQGTVYLVLQNSYFKTEHIDLPDLYLDMAKSVGMLGEVVSSISIGRNKNKASLNRGARRYAEGRSYYESVIRLVVNNG